MTKKNKKTKTILSLPIDDNMIAIPRIELGSISYGDSTPAQNNKLTTLKKIEYLKQAESLGVDKKSALKILKSYLAYKKTNQPEIK